MTRIGAPDAAITAATTAAPIAGSEATGPRSKPTPGGGLFRAAMRAARRTDEHARPAGDADRAAQAQQAEQMTAHRDEQRRAAPVPAVPPAAPRAIGEIQAGGATAAAQPAAQPDAGLATDGDAAATATPDAGLTTSSSAPATSAPRDESPVAAWTAAAVGRAFGSFARAAQIVAAATAPGAVTATPDAVAAAAAQAAQTAAAPAATTGGVALGLDFEASTMTPLEQAVHDLIGMITDADEPGHRPAARDAPDIDAALLHALGGAATAPASRDAAQAAPVVPVGPARPTELPVNPNPSHIHLVLDDGPERVVVTVAMRGSDVHVALRASDDATSAALARNAGALDHAMRTRGLALGELTTDREPHERPHQEPEARRERDARPHSERFELEDKP